MNTPTKCIFYLFGRKIAKNEPQTKVWGSLTCKSQCSRLIAERPRLWSCSFAELRSRLRARSRWSHDLRDQCVGAAPCYLTPAFFLARSIAAICSSESLMEP